MRWKFLINLALSLSLFACAKDQSESPAQETLGEDGSGSASSEENAAKPGSESGESQAGAETNTQDGSNPMNAVTSSDMGESQAETPVDPSATGGATGAEMGTEAPSPNSGSNTGRLVKYVMRDNTPIMMEPQAGSKQVGTLSKGDAVLIEDLGAFGKIGEGKFVAKGSLSDKIIGRAKSPNPWK